MCKNHLHARCKFKDKCRRKHIEGLPYLDPTHKRCCRWYVALHCEKGNRCNFDHHERCRETTQRIFREHNVDIQANFATQSRSVSPTVATKGGPFN